MWPLSISYPCLVLILLVKYTVKWKRIALFIIKIKLYRPLKNNLDNFNFWYICYLSDYIFFLITFELLYISTAYEFVGFLNLFLILRFLFSYDLLSHYFDWFLSTLKNHNIQKPRPPKISFQNILHLSHGHAMENLPFEYLRERDLISVR